MAEELQTPQLSLIQNSNKKKADNSKTRREIAMEEVLFRFPVSVR